MLRLPAELKKRKLAETNWSSGSSNSRNVSRREEERCFFDVEDLVLLDILRRLPVESLLKFRSVCKRWRNIIKRDEYFKSLHFTSSETRLQRDENTFLIYPTCRYKGTMPIKRFSFSQKDLRLDDSQGHGILDGAVVTSDNMTLDENQCISILEPVHGLVCFVRGRKIDDFAVLVYNPSTRAKTPWIETSTSEVFRSLLGVESHMRYQGGRGIDSWKTSFYSYMFGFGIDPTTDQHKVLCIYEITGKCRREIVSRELVCGVITEGESTWRKIDQVPHDDIAISKNYVHVCGSIYWMMPPKKNLGSQNRVITVFDLGSETFRFIAIPNFILGVWETIPLVHRLAEVDGHIAILVREGDDMLALWIYDVGNASDAAAGGNWSKETMQLPCRWDAVYDLAFKCITGTSLVIIKFLKERRERHEFRCEYLRVYNRREKKYYGYQFSVLLEPTGSYGDTYSITPFVGTLLPVN